MVDNESMITPDMADAIGREDEPITVEINRELVRRLAEAIEETDPSLLTSLETVNKRVLVPHWAIFTVSAQLRQQKPPDIPKRGLMAGDEHWMLAPIYIGDILTIVGRIADIQERIGGRVGHSLFVHYEWTYMNQNGMDVARSRRTVAYFKDKHNGESS